MQCALCMCQQIRNAMHSQPNLYTDLYVLMAYSWLRLRIRFKTVYRRQKWHHQINKYTICLCHFQSEVCLFADYIHKAAIECKQFTLCVLVCRGFCCCCNSYIGNKYECSMATKVADEGVVHFDWWHQIIDELQFIDS